MTLCDVSLLLPEWLRHIRVRGIASVGMTGRASMGVFSKLRILQYVVLFHFCLNGLRHLGREVLPGGVEGFDKGGLFISSPSFELFFACDGGRGVGEGFVVDEAVAVVFFCEAGRKVASVLVEAAGEVAGDANVDRARKRGKDVYVEGLHKGYCIVLCSASKR